MDTVSSTTSAPASELNESVDAYARLGYVVVRDALSEAEVDALTAEALELCRGERGGIAGVVAAADGESDDDILRRYLCIHHPHKLSKVMLDALRQPVIVDVLTQVIGPDVKAMQSMLFIKAEGKPGQAWHQDEFFIPTRDRSLTAAWIALDDATIDNGCLWVLPGSHAPGVIYRDRPHNDPRFDVTVELYGFPYDDDDAVPLEVPAGTAVIFNGYLVHRSLPNRVGTGFRRALANHYMSAQSLLPWQPPREGEHMAKTDYRDIVLVAGTDPYDYKGTEDRSTPHVRAEAR